MFLQNLSAVWYKDNNVKSVPYTSTFPKASIINGNAPIFSSCPWVKKKALILFLLVIKYWKPGKMTSIPSKDSSGYLRPASKT